MTSVRVSPDELQRLAVRVLMCANTSEPNARSVAAALVAAEVDGQRGHGLSRLSSYAAQAMSGKVDGHAVPQLTELTAAAVRVDACHGFAYPAMDCAVEAVARQAAAMGVATAAVFNSHHFGVAGYHAERLARDGLVALVFSNSPQAIAPWGGRSALFGTNPIAFAVPRRNSQPMVVDLSLSKVARGKIMVAAERGEPIPPDWALDADGNPTTDARAAMNGTMLPMGDAKGAALVLMVEILAAALTGGNFGYQASSFFSAEGDPPSIGHLVVGFAPGPLSGESFASRIEELLDAITGQDQVRLPGTRRLAARARVEQNGIELIATFHDELLALAGESTRKSD